MKTIIVTGKTRTGKTHFVHNVILPSLKYDVVNLIDPAPDDPIKLRQLIHNLPKEDFIGANIFVIQDKNVVTKSKIDCIHFDVEDMDYKKKVGGWRR